ncbi:MAG TPA: hypothetical protein VGD72_07465 [Mycobacteriales bacterium]|jgi:hypothetical protein
MRQLHTHTIDVPVRLPDRRHEQLLVRLVVSVPAPATAPVPVPVPAGPAEHDDRLLGEFYD